MPGLFPRLYGRVKCGMTDVGNSVFVPERFSLGRPVRALRIPARRPRVASQAAPPIVCLWLTHPLHAYDPDALVAAISTRVQSAVSPPCSAVLDLAETRALDEGMETALRLLNDVLADNCVRLRLVLPESQVRVAFVNSSTGMAVGRDCVHVSVRAAMLAAYADLPGAAVVTSARRGLLEPQPQPLTLPLAAGGSRGSKAQTAAAAPRCAAPARPRQPVEARNHPGRATLIGNASPGHILVSLYISGFRSWCDLACGGILRNSEVCRQFWPDVAQLIHGEERTTVYP